MDYHRRLFSDETICQEAYSEKDERDAQPLTHIQNHILLESYLRLLDELDKESHSEASDEKCSDKESSMKLRKLILVHQNLEYSQKEVADSLI
jgi:hypothetical protein